MPRTVMAMPTRMTTVVAPMHRAGDALMGVAPESRQGEPKSRLRLILMF